MCTRTQPVTLTLQQQATALGKQAFETGRERVPARDVFLMDLIRESNSHKESVAILDSWLAAWDKANLNAPIPD